MRRTIATSAALVFACSGCGDQSPKGEAGTLKYEAACNIEGLPAPKRQTIILIDQASLAHADAPDFRTKNPGITDAVIAVGSADTAVTGGALDPRERVSLLLAPIDGGSPKLLFTGCAPALSTSERALIAGKSSAVSGALATYFGNDASSKTTAMAKDYQTRLLGAIIHAGEEAPETPPSPAPSFQRSSLVASLRAAQRLADPADGIPRIILIAPRAIRSAVPAGNVAAARAAGFAAAKEASVDFGMAEMHVALAPDARGRDFLTAFMLGSGARLMSWSSKAPTGLGAAPKWVRRFTGDIQYGKFVYPIVVRVAADASGALVNSWITLKQDRTIATPIAGNASCTAAGACRITTDNTGFAQLWSPAVGGDPVFGPELYYSGLRSVEFSFADGKGAGRVYDPMVEDVGGVPDLKFRLTETN